MVNANRCILYYGETVPNPTATRALTDSSVVLQPYHPLVRSAEYAAYFPNCRRFVYWNPTGVHGQALLSLGRRVRLEQWDPDWRIARLDLTDAATRDYVVETGLGALGAGDDVQGLFVDDLDLWSGGRRRNAAMRVLERVVATAHGEFSFFVNRGFALWRSIPRLHAVTLEELAPCDAESLSATDAAWVRRTVLPSVRRARKAGTRVFGISYAQHVSTTLTGSLSVELHGLTDSTVQGTRDLDEWPEDLK